MTLADADLRETATRLERAYRTAAPTDGLPDGATVADGYRVQRSLRELREQAGARHLGYKVGATSAGSQRVLATDGPMFGPLLDEMLIPDAGECSLAALIEPRIEIEIAFEIGDTPPEPRRAAPAFEIVDSRIAAGIGGVQHAIADLGRACRFVLGPWVELDRLGPTDSLEGRLLRDGVQLSAGSASTVLGDPRHALRWLADALVAQDAALRPGEIVLSGTFIPPSPVHAGERLQASFGGLLGSVSVQFIE